MDFVAVMKLGSSKAARHVTKRTQLLDCVRLLHIYISVICFAM